MERERERERESTAPRFVHMTGFLIREREKEREMRKCLLPSPNTSNVLFLFPAAIRQKYTGKRRE